MGHNNAAQAREDARRGDGKFGAQTRAEDTAVDLDRSADDWHIGPSSWSESFEASRVMRDWEDRLQCAEAVNEAVDMMSWDRKDAVAYLVLTDARSDDYEDYYSAAIVDSKGNLLGTCAVPGYTFNDATVPADFQVEATNPVIGKVRADVEAEAEPRMTIDVAKVRAYGWDNEQDKVLVRMSEIASRALASHGR